ETDAPVTKHLGGLDEGPAHIAVLDQPVVIRDAAGRGEALRRGDPRLGHRHHHVCIHRMLPGQTASHLGAGGVDVAPVHLAVGSGEVDELEETETWLDLYKRVIAPDSGGVDDHPLARADLPDEP